MKKMKKVISILSIMLVITSSIAIVNQTNTSVKGAGGVAQQGKIVGHGNSIGLDLNYMWNSTVYISNAVHKAYHGQELRKGRMFGSNGTENYTKTYIYNQMVNLSLDGVQNIQLGPIQNKSYKNRHYTDFLNVNNTNLHIYKQEYNLPRDVPKNETYVSPSTFPDYIGHGFFEGLNHNFSGENIAVRNILSINWPFGGSVTGEFRNVQCTPLEAYNIIIGNVTYINETEQMPYDQKGRVFLTNETSECQSILENVTNASGVILIHDSGRGYSVSQSVIDNCSFVVKRVNDSDNMTNITNRLKNGERVFADNVLDTNTITFSFDFDLPDILWPDENFLLDIPFDDSTLWYSFWYMYASLGLRVLSGFPELSDRRCEGLIFYNDLSNDNHRMMWFNEGWYRLLLETKIWKICIPFPSLPVFSVNHTVGSFLNFYGDGFYDDNRVSFFDNQTYAEEPHIGDPSTWTTVGVKAYDVVGHINITKSPENKIVVISNRHDSYAGECPGDSSAGGGIVLGIAKYFKEYHIKPKYNLTFLQTTGEEAGYRGAQYYSDVHRNDNIIMFFEMEQLGMKEYKTNLTLDTSNSTVRRIVWEITNQTHYIDRTIYDVTVPPSECYHNKGDRALGHFSEDVVWMQRNLQIKPSDPPASATNCSTICFSKENWTYHHQTGDNFTEGDSLKNTDRNDLNLTFEVAWNATKYFTVNPNCWANNETFSVFDSPNDGDNLNDSIRTNFTIHSILPNDKVRVEMNLGHLINGFSIETPNVWDSEYVVINGSLNVSHTFTIPDNVSDGEYSIDFNVYNSTGIINRIIYGGLPGTYSNDTTNSSGWYHLYHPLGYTKVGNSPQTIQNRISGSVFTANENGRADNITAYINQNFLSPASHKCMLYRTNDSMLIGTTTENWKSRGGLATSPWWAVFNFTGTKPLLEKGTQYVITCWGNNSLSGIYYDNSFPTIKGAYNDTITYGTPPNKLNYTQEPRYYSIYCSYTPDVTPPRIINVSHSPDTIGFGYTVAIHTNVTDNQSGVNSVKVNITYPDQTHGNYTMSLISGSHYRYVFGNTWTTGQYNYTIYAADKSTNINGSGGHHFHVSADAKISIATLKDSYTGNQYINITDPPNPPSNYTLVGRGLDWNTYYNDVTGQNVMEVSAGPVNYQDQAGEWTPINCTLQQLTINDPAYAYGYRLGNGRGLFQAYFKPNAQNDWPLAFAYNKSTDPTTHVIRSKLMGVGYVDPQSNWAYQYLQNVQNSQGQTNGNAVTYPSVFTGTDVTWTYSNTQLKEAIIMSNSTKTVLQNHPPSSYGLNDASSFLVFITKLDYQNLNLYNTSGILSGNVTISDTGVDFKDVLGYFKCGLPLGDAYELHNETARQSLTYRIIHYNGNTYLLSGLRIADLNQMIFPVVIDPTLTVYSTSSDGYIYKSSGNYTTARTSSTGTVSSTTTYISIGQKKDPTGPPTSTYSIYRGFVFFNTSSLPSNAYLDNATLSLYKKDDLSTTDFDITVQNGQPTYPHDPMQTSDYNMNDYSGNGGTLTTGGLHNGYNNMSLTNLNWITKNGTTKLCLRSSRDINGNTPTGNEYVNIYANEQGSGYQPKLVIHYRNQSKIKNTGSTNIKGYLLIQIQFYSTSQGQWLVDKNTIDETSPRTINNGGQLALDRIFNNKVRASDLTHGIGTYRVYTAFRDPFGNILKTNDGVEMKAWWQFSKT
jgi:hypothetical protein